ELLCRRGDRCVRLSGRYGCGIGPVVADRRSAGVICPLGPLAVLVQRGRGEDQSFTARIRGGASAGRSGYDRKIGNFSRGPSGRLHIPAASSLDRPAPLGKIVPAMLNMARTKPKRFDFP